MYAFSRVARLFRYAQYGSPLSGYLRLQGGLPLVAANTPFCAWLLPAIGKGACPLVTADTPLCLCYWRQHRYAVTAGHAPLSVANTHRLLFYAMIPKSPTLGEI